MKITTINDLKPSEKLLPHCVRCDKTGEYLDMDKIKKRFGEGVPIELVSKYIVCPECGKKDEIVLQLTSNEPR